MPQPDPTTTLNPYISARKKYDGEVAAAEAGKVLWQILAILSLLGLVVRETYHAQRDLQPKLLPYVVEVDRLGNAQALEVAEELKGSHTRNFEAALKNFVTLARRVTPDIALQRRAIFGVHSMLTKNDPAFGKYHQEFSEVEGQTNTAYARAAKETVETAIHSVLQQTEQSWEVEWTETIFARANGRIKESIEMRGLFEMYQAQEKFTDKKARKANAMGIYVRNYSWGKREAREVYR